MSRFKMARHNRSALISSSSGGEAAEFDELKPTLVNRLFRNMDPDYQDIEEEDGKWDVDEESGNDEFVREITSDVYSVAAKTRVHWVEASILAGLTAALSASIFFCVLCDMLKRGWSLTKYHWQWPTSVTPMVRFGQVISLLFAVFLLQEDILQSLRDIMGHITSKRNQYACSSGMVVFWHSMRLVVGILSVLTATLIIVQSEVLLDLFANFAALTFLTCLNLLMYTGARLGLFGKKLQKATVLCNLKIKSTQLVWWKSLLTWIPFVPFAVLFGIVCWKQMHDGGPALLRLSNVPTAAGRSLGLFELQTTTDITGKGVVPLRLSSRPVYREAVLSNYPVKDHHLVNGTAKKQYWLFYCDGRYVMEEHDWDLAQIRAASSAMDIKDPSGKPTTDCGSWLIRSPTSLKFSPLEISSGWEAKDPVVGNTMMASFLMENAECTANANLDSGNNTYSCNLNGRCVQNKGDFFAHCQCNEGWFGPTCSLSAPCPEIHFAQLPGSTPRKYTMVPDTFGLHLRERSFAYPVYYSYVPPANNGLHVKKGFENFGSWFLLYYVPSWRRWLVADARLPNENGGFEFTGDTIAELQHQMFSQRRVSNTDKKQQNTTFIDQISSADWLKDAQPASMPNVFTVVSEETELIDPGKVATWTRFQKGIMYGQSGSIKAYCADCVHSNDCFMGTCNKKTRKCVCNENYIGALCTVPRAEIKETIMFKWGVKPPSETLPNDLATGRQPATVNAAGRFICARCPTRRITFTSSLNGNGSCSTKRAPFRVQGDVDRFFRPAFRLIGGKEKTELHLFEESQAYCLDVPNNKQFQACIRAAADKAVYDNARSASQNALVCGTPIRKQNQGKGSYPRLDLDVGYGEVWNTNSASSKLGGQISLLYNEFSDPIKSLGGDFRPKSQQKLPPITYTHLSNEESFELLVSFFLSAPAVQISGNQTVSPMFGIGRPLDGIQGIGTEILPQDVNAPERVLQLRCKQSEPLRRALVEALNVNYARERIAKKDVRVQMLSALGVTPQVTSTWTPALKSISKQIRSEKKQGTPALIERCAMILEELQIVAKNMSKISNQKLESECGSDIQTLSHQECSQEAWATMPLEWVHVKYEYKLNAYDKSHDWMYPYKEVCFHSNSNCETRADTAMVSDVKDAEDCQQLCAAKSRCHFFNFYEKYLSCQLIYDENATCTRNSEKVREELGGAISGPKKCKEGTRTTGSQSEVDVDSKVDARTTGSQSEVDGDSKVDANSGSEGTPADDKRMAQKATSRLRAEINPFTGAYASSDGGANSYSAVGGGFETYSPVHACSECFDSWPSSNCVNLINQHREHVDKMQRKRSKGKQIQPTTAAEVCTTRAYFRDYYMYCKASCNFCKPCGDELNQQLEKVRKLQANYTQSPSAALAHNNKTANASTGRTVPGAGNSPSVDPEKSTPAPSPTPSPTAEPSLLPTAPPTAEPSPSPTLLPTAPPTAEPSLSPTLLADFEEDAAELRNELDADIQGRRFTIGKEA
jgi:hypothetical protein